MGTTGLAGYTPKTETVEYPGGEFAVRGLSAEDFTVLLRNHYAPLASLFERYVSEANLENISREYADGALDLSDMKGVVLDALKTAPALMGDVIARASDEPDKAYTARLLPTVVQIDAIGKIVTLTLEAEGGLEKLMETVSMVVTTVASAVAKNRSP